MTNGPRPKFNAFTIKAPGLANRIITPAVISVVFDPQAPPTPPPARIQVNALWDSGATRSLVTTATVQALGLQPVGRVNMRHAAGEGVANTYLVNIELPNNVGLAAALVSECHETAGHFGAIIGMDVINQGDLSISNMNGATWMTFRIPSVSAVDFVLEFQQQDQVAHLERNAPCHCGSGKKYRKCHGKP